MDAWSLTDHGHMNGFVHAYLHAESLRSAGSNFKFIPGCEMYVHPDLDAWSREAAAAKSQDNKSRIDREKEKAGIVTPLVATTDGDDETVAVGTEEETLTIENEEETKSGKFYDPIKRRHHLVVLPKTSEGLRRLFHLVSRGYKEGFYRFPRVDYKMLREAAAGDHLLVTSACTGGPFSWEVFKHLQQVQFNELRADLLDDSALMTRVVNDVGNTYGQLVDSVGRDNVYIELQFNKLVAQHLVNRALIEFATRSGLEDRLVVTCDSHYSRPDRWKEREIYKKLGWLNHNNYDPSQIPQSREELKCELYPKNARQVWDTYLETAAEYDFYDDDLVCRAIERTHDIAHENIGSVEPDRRMKLPSYVVPKGMTEDKALLEACKKGLVWRGLADKEAYIDRLKLELKVIKQKSFSKYFLTMQAIMDIAREKMLLGPGRGSACGSLVAYVLGITNVDPIEHGLLFSRFLSMERTEPPDIDSDVADRDVLIELLKENFGSDAVVPISNYNTFKLKSLVKDISKFYGIEFDEVNRALAPVDSEVKQAVMKPGDSKDTFVLTYEDSYAHSKSFRDFIDKHPQVAEPIQILFKQNRSLGKHAGGVIVAENISENMPLIKTKGELQTPWIEGMTYKHLEPMGWIKFDLLGLETLRIIHRCIELIIKREQGVEKVSFDQVRQWFEDKLDPSRLDLNDPAVYEKVYRGGNFAGVFQLASKGARRLFMQGKPENLIDIATLTSVFRPGPLAANVHNIYIEAKNNPDKIDYGHPLIEKVLGPTYNCVVGDTVVTTEMGDYKIKDIVDRQMIGVSLPSLNEETGEMEEDTIVAAVCNGRKETIEIEIEDGRTLRLTPDHRVCTTRGWVEAGELTVEDEILGLESETRDVSRETL
jgi:DNA polymerase-3 subunit alpha